MMVGKAAAAAAAASGANNPKLQDEYAEEQTHDDFFALHASRHTERQWTQLPLRVKRSIYTAVILSFCAFTIKLSSVSIASIKGEYVTNDRSLNLTVGRRPIIIESNLSPEERWNSSSQNKVVIEQQNMNRTETETTQLQSDGRASRHIWIDAISYAEGIAGWKTSLLELLHLAKTMDATLVEPCMESGRLGSCGGGGKNKIPVSEIFDLAKYMSPSDGKEFPLLASYDNYQAALDDSDSDIRTVKLCLLNNLRLPIDERCSADTTRVRDMEQNVRPAQMKCTGGGL